MEKSFEFMTEAQLVVLDIVDVCLDVRALILLKSSVTANVAEKF
jgi:hypothetical protein